MIKKYIYLIVCLLCLVTLSSCNKVRSYTYDLVEIGMTVDECIEFLGEYDVVEVGKPDMYSITFCWFDKADTLDEAKKMAKDGKKVLYIQLVCHYKTGQVLGKKKGYVTKDFVIGDVALSA